jgi:hypothetical protein
MYIKQPYMYIFDAPPEHKTNLRGALLVNAVVQRSYAKEGNSTFVTVTDSLNIRG